VNTQNTEVHEKTMAGVPEQEISVLRGLTGYEQMLEIDRIIRQYDVTEAELLEQLHTTASSQASPAIEGQSPYNPEMSSFIPESEEAPKLPSTANVLDKSNFRFEYDPSQKAAQRRANIAQAILCPGCGVALGIPEIRPIKVTCPHCLQETVFDA
jgi:hypothetical protein